MKKLSIIMPVWNQEELVIRALRSVPRRNDIETIVIDDASTDNTVKVIEKNFPDVILLKNSERIRAAASINRGLDIATGEYYMQLDSDDSILTGRLEDILTMNRPEDLIFFVNIVNNGDLWDPYINKTLCDHACLYKRSLIGNTRYGTGLWGQGWQFHHDILAKPHTEYYYREVMYLYNYPREGSNLNLAQRGLLK